MGVHRPWLAADESRSCELGFDVRFVLGDLFLVLLDDKCKYLCVCTSSIRLTRIQSGRREPHPKHSIPSRLHVLHELPSTRSSSHFCACVCVQIMVRTHTSIAVLHTLRRTRHVLREREITVSHHMITIEKKLPPQRTSSHRDWQHARLLCRLERNVRACCARSRALVLVRRIG